MAPPFNDTTANKINMNLAKLVFESYLPPTKIKRKYKCAQCNHSTVNPRTHLRHRIAAHDDKIRIVECPLCVYACQYRQKLNRHLRLVHNTMPNQIDYADSPAMTELANMVHHTCNRSELDIYQSAGLNLSQASEIMSKLAALDYTQAQQEPLNLSIKFKSENSQAS